MNKKLINLFLFSSLSISSLNYLLESPPSQAQTHKNIYKCINNQGIPTTVVDTKRGRIELIAWKSDYFRNSGWTPEKRCQEVTKRFQQFSDNNALRYITTGIINKQKAICVGKPSPGKGIQCDDKGLLITLQPDDKPDDVLKNLFSNATQVGGTPVTRDPEGKYIFPISMFLEDAPLMEQNEVNEVNEVNPEIPSSISNEPQIQTTPIQINQEIDNIPGRGNCFPPLCQ